MSTKTSNQADGSIYSIKHLFLHSSKGNFAYRDDDTVARAHPEAIVGHQEGCDPHEAEPELSRAYK